MAEVSIGVLDYGQGNLYNACNGLLRAGAKDARIVQTSKQIAGCDALVIPGVGSFYEAMKRLRPLQPALEDFAACGRPLLGICLGMQVLFADGEEGRACKGLGLLSGSVRRLSGALRLPHIGWDTVAPKRGSVLFDGVPPGSWYYFAHSYAAEAVDPRLVAGRTTYGRQFVSVVEYKNVFGVQFHPEKSAGAGARVLRNFVDLAKRGMR